MAEVPSSTVSFSAPSETKRRHTAGARLTAESAKADDVGVAHVGTQKEVTSPRLLSSRLRLPPERQKTYGETRHSEGDSFRETPVSPKPAKPTDSDKQ